MHFPAACLAFVFISFVCTTYLVSHHSVVTPSDPFAYRLIASTFCQCQPSLLQNNRSFDPLQLARPLLDPEPIEAFPDPTASTSAQLPARRRRRRVRATARGGCGGSVSTAASGDLITLLATLRSTMDAVLLLALAGDDVCSCHSII